MPCASGHPVALSMPLRILDGHVPVSAQPDLASSGFLQDSVAANGIGVQSAEVVRSAYTVDGCQLL